MVISKKKFGEIWAQLCTFGLKIINDWSFSLASLLAYYLLVSIIPLAVCIISVTIVFFGDNNQIQEIIQNVFLMKDIANQTGVNITGSVQNGLVYHAGISSIVSFIIAVITGSRLIIGIDDVLVIVYQSKERTLLRQNLHGLKLLFLFIIFMPIIIISAFVPVILEKDQGLYYFLAVLVNIFVTFCLCYIIYQFVPPKKMNWRNTWCGALIVAIVLQLVVLIFPAYVHRFLNNYAGIFGFLIITIILFYVFGLLLVIGAQINAYFFDHIQPLPKSLGNCLSTFNNPEYTALIDQNPQSDNLSIATENTNLNK